MKNIHVLPTDKPSRLFKHNNAFFIEKEFYESTPRVISQNIYITSDEEIKDGDYYLYLKDNSVQQFIYKHHIKLLRLDIQKKIILTDNQDLIDDGVQAIDDEFLEWFIKNPKSENVYVYKKYKQVNQNNPVTRGSTALGFSHYEVQSLDLSAPIGTNEKEVVSNLPNGDDFFKQETLGYICPTTKKQCDDECCVSAEDCHIEASFDIISDCEEPKQETLEEVALKLFPKTNSHFDRLDEVDGNAYYRSIFKQGAKWQQERMYSEESECVNMYLDDLKIPRKSQDDKEYSIVGRIKQLEKKYLKQLSEVENYYLQQFKNK